MASGRSHSVTTANQRIDRSRIQRGSILPRYRSPFRHRDVATCLAEYKGIPTLPSLCEVSPRPAVLQLHPSNTRHRPVSPSGHEIRGPAGEGAAIPAMSAAIPSRRRAVLHPLVQPRHRAPRAASDRCRSIPAAPRSPGCCPSPTRSPSRASSARCRAARRMRRRAARRTVTSSSRC